MVDTKKKQGVIDKLKIFFEKYFGIGDQTSFAGQEHKALTYDFDRQGPLSMVAKPKTPYGKNHKKATLCQNIQK